MAWIPVFQRFVLACFAYFIMTNGTLRSLSWKRAILARQNRSSQPGMVNPCCQLLERLPEFYSLKELHQHAFFGRERVNAWAVIGPSSVRRTLEPFQWRRCGETSESRPRAHGGFAERIDTILHWTELRSCVKVEATVLGTPSLIVRMISVDVKQHWTQSLFTRARELCESRGGRPGLPVLK